MKPLSRLLATMLLVLAAPAWLAAGQDATDRPASEVVAISVEDAHRAAQIAPFRWSRDVVRVGGAFTFGVDDSAKQLVLVAADSTIEGRVDGDVVLVFGTTRLASTAVIDGSLIMIGGQASVASEARVRRDLVVVGGVLDAPAEFKAGGDHVIVDARALGGRVHDVVAWLTHGLLWGRLIVPGLPWVWLVVAIFFAIYLVLSLVLDRPIRRTADILAGRPLSAFVVGMLMMLLAGPVCVLLAISVVGISVVPVVLCALLIAMLVGRIATVRWIGAGLLRPTLADSRARSLLVFATGFAVLCLAYMVPILGLATWAMVGVLGLGSSTLAFIAEYRKEIPLSVRPIRPVSAAASAQSSAIPASRATSLHDPIQGSDSVSDGEAHMSDGGVNAAAFDQPNQTPAPMIGGGLDAISFPRAYFRDRLASSVLDLVLTFFAWQFAGVFQRERSFVLLLLVYFIGFWAWKGTTIGGIICQLRVVRTDGAPLRFIDALVRGLSAIFSVLVAGLGFFWILRDPERQAWHDRIAGTYVVKVPRNWPL